uniref:Uncharacterized protein n=1 Tax=Knipowitschia caucasica TaxID=637954 RepID=A0AAV2JN80_KNICA
MDTRLLILFLSPPVKTPDSGITRHLQHEAEILKPGESDPYHVYCTIQDEPNSGMVDNVHRDFYNLSDFKRYYYSPLHNDSENNLSLDRPVTKTTDKETPLRGVHCITDFSTWFLVLLVSCGLVTGSVLTVLGFLCSRRIKGKRDVTASQGPDLELHSDGYEKLGASDVYTSMAHVTSTLHDAQMMEIQMYGQEWPLLHMRMVHIQFFFAGDTNSLGILHRIALVPGFTINREVGWVVRGQGTLAEHFSGTELHLPRQFGDCQSATKQILSAVSTGATPPASAALG